MELKTNKMQFSSKNNREKLILGLPTTLRSFLFEKIKFLKCGMRQPNKGKSEDDLSRLTGSSSSTSSSTTPSANNEHHHHQHHRHHENHNDNGQCNETCAIISSSQSLILRVNNNNNEKNDDINNIKNLSQYHQQQQQHQTSNLPSYLPEYIDPLEWQKSRKRKERLDSTSSNTQDRKLVRSNSEELISNADCEVIRRVSSHEDFNKKQQELRQLKSLEKSNDDSTVNVLKTIQENDIQQKDEQQQQQQHRSNNNKESNILIRLRLDTSPARSNHHRWSSSANRSDDSDCEHERRRSTERFSKTRASPGRKAGVVKKPNNKSRKIGFVSGNDENAYKYDISALKYERRGFVSKIKLEDRCRKEEAADGEKITSSNYYDNTTNLIDLNQQQQQRQQQQQQPSIDKASSSSNEEILPWDSSVQDYQTPVLCRRFSPFQYTSVKKDEAKICNNNNNNDNYLNNNNNNNNNKQTKFNMNILNDTPGLPDNLKSSIDSNEPIRSSFRTFTNMENLKTHEVMQSLPPLGLLQQTPEERLKYINKKLNSLKKRVTQLEENYEKNYGYRPSQIERFNDKQIKGVLVEISKLRKEKQELKSDPMAALGLKISGDMDAEKKLKKMIETLDEIDKKLKDKRIESNRSENLDILTADQLVQEKTAVQHSLLYFESLYGRPANRLERDIARPLYERYRLIKRMVSRSITISSSGIGASELPTILENEALSYETIISQDVSTSSPSETILGGSSTTTATSSSSSSVAAAAALNELTDCVDSARQDKQQQQRPAHQQHVFEENLHQLSQSELWDLLDKVREEKKNLKKTIRDFENLFEEQNGRKMLKNDRKTIDETFAQYKEKKAKARLLQALIKKHMAK